MTRPLRKLDLTDVLNASFGKREILNRAKAMLDDNRREARLKAQECRVCFYWDSKVGGAAMTSSPCGLCEEVMGFGSTNVDRLCIDCARDHRLCKHCGGDIESKERRKL